MMEIECCGCGETIVLDSHHGKAEASISDGVIWVEFGQRCPMCGQVTPVRCRSTEVDAFPFTKCDGCVCLMDGRWLCSAAFCEVRG